MRLCLSSHGICIDVSLAGTSPHALQERQRTSARECAHDLRRFGYVPAACGRHSSFFGSSFYGYGPCAWYPRMKHGNSRQSHSGIACFNTASKISLRRRANNVLKLGSAEVQAC